jgi:hypothetical protein
MEISDTSLRYLGAATVAWGIVFAGFHFYWAAGGGVGMDEGSATLAESLYIAFVAVLGLVGAAVAHGLYQPWGARIGRRRLRLTALLGGLALLLGVVIGVGRWLAAGSLEGDGAAGIVITAYFLLGGALFTGLGSRRSGSDRAAPDSPVA